MHFHVKSIQRNAVNRIMKCRVYPVNIVIDGYALLFALCDIIRQNAIEDLYSYQAFHDLTFEFLDYLNERNIHVVAICLDTLYDEDKENEYCKRYENRYKTLLKCWDSDFQSSCKEFLSWL